MSNLQLNQVLRVMRRPLYVALVMLPVLFTIHYGVYWLRFEGQLGPTELQTAAFYLPIVIMLKMRRPAGPLRQACERFVAILGSSIGSLDSLPSNQSRWATLSRVFPFLDFWTTPAVSPANTR